MMQSSAAENFDQNLIQSNENPGSLRVLVVDDEDLDLAST